MKPQDQPSAGHRPEHGDEYLLDWHGDAAVVREAALDRLGSLVIGSDQVALDSPDHPECSAGLRSIDDEPADLVYDSVIDGGVVVGVRSGASCARQLTFESRDLVLEMEVSGNGHLVGQLVPPQPAMVELRHRGGTTPVMTDDLGCFHFISTPEGPVSFRCLPTESALDPVATSWITL
jgi:hypothetical protein